MWSVLLQSEVLGHMTVRIGVDIGGSGVRAAVVDDTSAVDDWCEISLEDREVETVVQAVMKAVKSLGVKSHFGVGVGVPGFVRGGIVVASPNFPKCSFSSVGFFPTYRNSAAARRKHSNCISICCSLKSLH